LGERLLTLTTGAVDPITLEIIRGALNSTIREIRAFDGAVRDVALHQSVESVERPLTLALSPSGGEGIPRTPSHWVRGNAKDDSLSLGEGEPA
jgi:hypothetical protein